MTFKELVNQIFREFAIDEVVSHSLIEGSRSARVKGSQELILSTRLRHGRICVGVRSGSVAVANSHKGYFWINAGANTLEIEIYPDMSRHPEHALMNLIIRRIEVLENELTFPPPAVLDRNCLVRPKFSHFPRS